MANKPSELANRAERFIDRYIAEKFTHKDKQLEERAERDAYERAHEQ